MAIKSESGGGGKTRKETISNEMANLGAQNLSPIGQIAMAASQNQKSVKESYVYKPVKGTAGSSAGAQGLNRNSGKKTEDIFADADKKYQDWHNTDAYKRGKYIQDNLGSDPQYEQDWAEIAKDFTRQENTLKANRDYWQRQVNQEKDAGIAASDRGKINALDETGRKLLQTVAFEAPDLKTDPDAQVREISAARSRLIKEYNLTGQDIKELSETMVRDKNAKDMEDLQKRTEAASQGVAGGVLQTGGSVAANLVSGLSGVGGILNELGTRSGRYSTLDPNNAGYAPQVYSSTVRNTVAQNILGDGSNGWKQAGSVLYQGATSAMDSAARLAVAALSGGATEGISLGLASLGAFSNTVQGMTQKGVSPDKAILMGAADALIEAGTEKFSVENLLGDIRMGKIPATQAVFNAFKQAGIEISEEEAGLVAGLAVQAIVLGGDSEINQEIQEAMQQGATYEEARKQAVTNLIREAEQTALVSGVSGGMSSAGGSIYSGIVDTANTLSAIRNDSRALDNWIANGGEQGQRARDAQAAQAAAAPDPIAMTAADIVNGVKHSGDDTPGDIDQAIRTTLAEAGKVSNKQAEAVLADPEAVARLEAKTGVPIEGSKSQQRAAVKKAMEMMFGLDQQGQGNTETNTQTVKPDSETVVSSDNQNQVNNQREQASDLWKMRDSSEWGEKYGTAHEAMVDNMRQLAPTFADDYFDDSRPDHQMEMVDILNEVDWLARQEQVSPAAILQTIETAYRDGGDEALEGLFNITKKGNLYYYHVKDSTIESMKALDQKHGTGAKIETQKHETVKENKPVSVDSSAEAGYNNRRSEVAQSTIDRLNRGGNDTPTLDDIMSLPEIQAAEEANNGTPTYDLPNREQIRQDGYNKAMQKGSWDGKDYAGPIKQERRMDIVIGLPGSGKSSVYTERLSQEHQSRVIDTDDFREYIPEYNGSNASVVHRESSAIRNMAMKTAIENGDNILLSTIGADAQKLEHQIQGYKEMGYEVYLHLNELPNNKAMARAIGRYLQEDGTTGRYVSPSLIAEYGDKPTETYKYLTQEGAVKNGGLEENLRRGGGRLDGDAGSNGQGTQSQAGNLLAGYDWYNNDVAYGEKPKLIETSEQSQNHAQLNTQGAPNGQGGTVKESKVGTNSYENANDPNAKAAWEDIKANNPESNRYTPETEAGQRAEARSRTDTKEKIQHEREYLVNKGKGWTAADVKTATEVVGQLFKAGDVDGAWAVYNAQRAEMTRAGQAIQAMAELSRAMKNATPEGRVAFVHKEIQAEIDSINRRRSQKNQVKVKHSAELDQAFYDASTAVQEAQTRLDQAKADKLDADAIKAARAELNKAQENSDAIKGKMIEYAASQVKGTAWEKWNAWRRLAMLDNPKTIIRNFGGNAAEKPVWFVKKALQWGIESTFVKDKSQRTTALVGFTEGDRALRSLAWEDVRTKGTQNMLEGGKYEDSGVGNAFQDARRVFDSKVLNLKQDKTTWNLNNKFFGDTGFKNSQYTESFAGYLKAQGITADQARAMMEVGNDTVIQKARDYAVQQALKSTYNDTNSFSEFVCNLHAKGNSAGDQALNMLMDSTLPFKKVPANILKRSVEFQPIGLTNDIVKAGKAIKSGGDATVHIESIASRLTGTALMALGGGLASGVFGFKLRGGGVSDDEKREGAQEYSIEWRDKEGELHSKKLGWMGAPLIPLFLGASVYEMFNTEYGADLDAWQKFMKTAEGVVAPMVDMSMLDGLKSNLESLGRGLNREDAAYTVVLDMASNYLMQGLSPTGWRAVENFLQPNEMTTYADAEKDYQRSFQQKVLAKIPFVDVLTGTRIEKRDEWGNTISKGGPWGQFKSAFLDPSDTKVTAADPIAQEISAINAELPEEDQFTIDKPKNTLSFVNDQGKRESRRLSAEEYTLYSEKLGQYRRAALEDAKEQDGWADMSAEQKKEALDDAMKSAADFAQRELQSYDYLSDGAKKVLNEASTASKKDLYPDPLRSAVEYTNTRGDKVKRDLTPEEYQAVKQGQETTFNDILTLAGKIPAYQRLSDPEKQRFIKYAGEYAKAMSMKRNVDGFYLSPNEWESKISSAYAITSIAKKVASETYNSAASALFSAQKAGFDTADEVKAYGDAYDNYRRQSAIMQREIEENATGNGKKYLEARKNGVSNKDITDIFQKVENATGTGKVNAETGKRTVTTYDKYNAIIHSGKSAKTVDKVLRAYLPDYDPDADSKEYAELRYDAVLDMGYKAEDFVKIHDIYAGESGVGKKKRVVTALEDAYGIDRREATELYKLFAGYSGSEHGKARLAEYDD